MDQDETWHARMPRPWPQCVRWGPSFPLRKGHSPQFLAHTCRGQMAGWIKMLLGRELGLDPSNIMFDGDLAPPFPKRGQSPQIFGPCLLWPNVWMDRDATWYEGRPWPRRHCVKWRPNFLPPKKGTAPPNFRPMCLVAKRLDWCRCHLVRR